MGVQLEVASASNPNVMTPVSSSAGLPVSPSADQDPILDHANGVKTTVTSSAAVFTPPAGCKFARFITDVDIFLRTDATTAADAAGSTLLLAGQAEILPVTPGVAVHAYCVSSATLRITPFKAR